MKLRLWLLLSLIVSGTTVLYVHRILNPWEHYIAVESGKVKAQLGDLYSPWVGSRELLLYRRNPYGPEVSHKIQIAFYGHAINQTYAELGSGVVNEQRFAYPVYVVFLLAPAVYIDFAEVQYWAPFILALLTAINVFLCLDILHWRLPWEAALALVLFTFASPQIGQGLRFEQLALVVGCLLTASAWFVSRNHMATAGVMLAFSTIKPQMALLPLCWFAIWAAGDWPKRWRLAAGFVVTLTGLMAGGALLLPGWPRYFIAGLVAYQKYAPTSSLLRLALGDSLGEIMGGIVVLGLFVFAWQNRKKAGDSLAFAAVLAAFFMGAILAFPLFTPFNQVMLILPVMLAIQEWRALSRLSRLVFIVTISWPWIVSSALLLFPPRMDSPNQIPLLPFFIVSFLPLILPLLLMTRRGELSPVNL